MSRRRPRDASATKVELPPSGGVALELHLVRLAPGPPCLGAWGDERGRPWAAIEAGRA
ncbi:MAG TPA: hypothetical protein VFS43_16115 [Polyangiaceae bacterium]|nr:hypothetical protein [Polyangiaceae bacterium]